MISIQVGLRSAALFFFAALAGCSDDGVGGACRVGFAGGTVTTSVAGCPGCSLASPNAAADGAGSSFATADFSSGGSITVRATASSQHTGTVGAVMRFPRIDSGPAFANIGVDFNTYLGGVLQQTIEGSHTAVGNIDGGGADHFYGGESSTPFDAVEAVIDLSGQPAAVRIYEICADY